MVTAIDTIDDLIRILREQPEARAAARREILTEDILELPATVKEILAVQREILATLAQHSVELRQQSAKLDQHSATLAQQNDTLAQQNDTLAEHSAILAEHSAILSEHSATLARQNATLAQHSEKLDQHSDILNQHSDILNQHSAMLGRHGRDIGSLKGYVAYQIAERRYTRIAREMGLSAARLLTLDEIDDMADLAAAADYTPSQLNSFRDCDLIIAAAHPEQGDCYVAVQVSSVVDHGDIRRAIDHAGMASRFTGKPAFPAVAGLEAADIAETRLASDAIHWHRIPSRHIQSR